MNFKQEAERDTGQPVQVALLIGDVNFRSSLANRFLYLKSKGKNVLERHLYVFVCMEGHAFPVMNGIAF